MKAARGQVSRRRKKAPEGSDEGEKGDFRKRVCELRVTFLVRIQGKDLNGLKLPRQGGPGSPAGRDSLCGWTAGSQLRRCCVYTRSYGHRREFGFYMKGNGGATEEGIKWRRDVTSLMF